MCEGAMWVLEKMTCPRFGAGAVECTKHSKSLATTIRGSHRFYHINGLNQQL